MATIDPNGIYDHGQTAALIGVAAKTLYNWRSSGRGPSPTRLHSGSRAPVRYRGQTILDWVDANTPDWPAETAA